MRTRTLSAAALTLAAGLPAAANTIAVTEFLNNPWGSDGTYEWIELFNHGAESVNLEGWTMKDNATTIFTFGDVTVESGGYLVAAKDKLAFEERWLESQSDDRVVGGVPFQFNNSEDGLYLRDDSGDLVWSFGYDEFDDYRAFFLAVDDFSNNNYGIPPQDDTLDELPRINIEGNDGNATTGLDVGLGYEGNGRTTDPFAYASAAGNEENPTPEWGSPLRGGYTAVPEPGSIALLGLGGLAMLQRRRQNVGH